MSEVTYLQALTARMITFLVAFELLARYRPLFDDRVAVVTFA